jgi:cell division protein FtsQ
MHQVWRKKWQQSWWIALGAVILVLLVAGINKKNHKVCEGIEVSVNGEGDNYFIDEKGVAAVLKATHPIKGEPIESIDLKTLEGRLKQDKWIANAQLYFDNKQVLQVLVEEKEPVARIFTSAGSSFYIDSTCRRLPLSEKLSARIPMFTSFPSDRSILSKPDSELLASSKELALFIQSDPFWKAQVAQIDITPEGFEMIPTVGNHIVALGKVGNWKEKFDRLFSFYKQVWTKVGFERYEKIDVQFNGQVVATVRGAKASIVDTSKARIAFEKLLESSKLDSSTIVEGGQSVVKDNVVEAGDNSVTKGAESKQAAKPVVAKQNIVAAVPKKQQTVRQPETAATKQVANKKVKTKPVPKALMKRPETP